MRRRILLEEANEAAGGLTGAIVIGSRLMVEFEPILGSVVLLGREKTSHVEIL